jgi:predicted nucleic acid-binding Zn ribbon protein
MHAVLDYLGLDDRMWEKEIINRWQELVGPQIARHARPGRISHAVLTVFVTHSIWLDELTRYGKAEMLQKLQQCFGKEQIRDIRFALDPDMR